MTMLAFAVGMFTGVLAMFLYGTLNARLAKGTKHMKTFLVLLFLTIATNVKAADFAPFVKKEKLYNWSIASMYLGAGADAASTHHALSHPTIRYRESNALYNRIIDSRCPCFGRRLALESAFVYGMERLTRWAFRKNQKAAAIAGNFSFAGVLIFTAIQNEQKAQRRN